MSFEEFMAAAELVVYGWAFPALLLVCARGTK